MGRDRGGSSSTNRFTMQAEGGGEDVIKLCCRGQLLSWDLLDAFSHRDRILAGPDRTRLKRDLSASEAPNVDCFSCPSVWPVGSRIPRGRGSVRHAAPHCLSNRPLKSARLSRCYSS